jgi:hypothetical protein
MSEESKYYTPEIEEFHVGFEYESLQDPRFPEKDSSWEKNTIKDEWDLKTFIGYYCGDHIEVRVKALDREDIESLGFEDRDMFYYDSKISYKNGVPFVENYMNKSKSKVLSKFIKSHMGGNYGLGSEYIFIEKVKSYENATHISRIIYNGDGSAMVTSAFRGTIKNKSELKRILKQIGV